MRNSEPWETWQWEPSAPQAPSIALNRGLPNRQPSINSAQSSCVRRSSGCPHQSVIHFFGVAMIPYAQLRLGRGFVPGHAAAYFVQRCVTHPIVRRCVASVLAAGVRSRHATLATRREPDLQDALGGLERDGIAMLPNLFSTSELADVVGFFLNQAVAAPGGGCMARDELPAGATMAAYHLATVVACPWLMTAINRADILRLASAFLGCKPTLCSRWCPLVLPWLKIARRDAGISSRSR